MWNFDYIAIKRFQSHIETRYEFKNGETTMVYGVNRDDLDGADSNGAGKSVLIRAITVGLLNIPNRGLGKEDYVMDGQADAEIELHMTNKAFGKRLKILRTIHRKQDKSSEIMLYENGKHNDQITSVPEGDKRILELLDITKDDILNYYIINQDNSHSFFKATDIAKKEIIARFTNTNLLDIVLDEVKADLAISNLEIERCSTEINKIEAKLNTISEQIKYEQEERSREQEDISEEYGLQLFDLEDERKTHLDEKTIFKNKLQQLNTILKNYGKIKDLKILENKKEKTKLALPSKKQEKREANALIDDLDKILNGKITCPNCQHEFSVADEEADLDELAETRKACEELVESITGDISELEKSIEAIDDDIEAIQEQKRKLRKTTSDIEYVIESDARLDKKMEKVGREIDIITTKKEALKDFKVNDKRIKELQSQVSIFEESKQSFLKIIEEKSVERDNITFWEINFSEMGLKTFLINKVLQNLEGHINNTLSRFKVNLLVKINGYTVLKSKKVNETIDILVSKDSGKTWKVYKRFSGGQKERINVSGILTLRSLINETSKYGGLNFLALDEFFEGLDVRGQKMVLPILEASGVTCLVISHMNNNIGANNELYIELEDGISSIRT